MRSAYRWSKMGISAPLGAACLLAVVVLMSSGCKAGGQGDSADTGHRLYRQSCAVCHGINGEGKPSLGATLRANEFIQSKSDDEMVQFLIEGRPADHPLNKKGIAMPPRGGNPSLTDEDLAAIVGYVRSLD
ncbi:MAG: cytochrome c [Acidobacteriota bacterium]